MLAQYRSFMSLVFLGTAVVTVLEPFRCPGADELQLRVRETAGIRRFGYPVSTTFDVRDPLPTGTYFRLTENGKPIAAQFRPLGRVDEQVQKIAVDFEVDFMPFESREYVVEHGPDVPDKLERERGLRLQETEDSFEIANGQALLWIVPKKLRGLLTSVKTPRTDYMRPDSAGLAIQTRHGQTVQMGGPGPSGLPVSSAIVKQGPLSVGVRFQSGMEFRSQTGITSVVELEFPRSKSWVYVNWTVDDPQDLATGLSADLNLNIVGEPTLVDFGAGSGVYATVAPGQVASFRAPAVVDSQPSGRRRWEVWRGPLGKLEPYVLGPEGGTRTHPEGWAHVMDRERCTAVAVRDFAKPGNDQLEVMAGGRLQVSRVFSPDRKPPTDSAKSLRFWLHFVPMPPHIGAVTSPQSMQSPLEVTWHSPRTIRPNEPDGDDAADLDGRNSAFPSAPAAEPQEVTDEQRLAARAKAVLAQTSGALRLRGLRERVEVLRDRWGVPHIHAQNAEDLFFAQGFVQAQDRLWQMEIWRRAAEGRLAEIVGPSALERDRIARLLQYRGDLDAEWSSYSPDARSIIEAFVRGVNAFITDCRDRLPIEFQLTGIQPQPWNPEVCLGRMAGFIMCRNASAEVLRAELIRDLGPELAGRLLPTDPARTIEIPGGLDLNLIDQRIVLGINSVTGAVKVPLSSTAAPADSKTPGRTKETAEPGDEGSNNWTVSGRLTNTGKPILANDPHRPVTLPSLRYIVHLVCPARGEERGWNVIGGTEPALPGVTIGHNERVAWGLTIVGTDQQDLYVEELHPEDPDRYRVGAEWLPMQVWTEQIAVRDEDTPRPVTLKRTRHGPVIFEDAEQHRAYALRWAGSEPGTAGYLAALALDRVQSWPEFLKAADRWKVPSENLVYADVDGHIGWIAAALTPMRRGWDGLLPVPGASGKYEWTGFLPTDELPRQFNPAAGYIATANHNILPPAYARVISFEWAAPFRHQKIDEVIRTGIKERRRFSIEDFQRLQHDSVSIPARRLVALLRQARRDQSSPADEISLLLEWDGRLDRDSAAAALYEVWQKNVTERVLQIYLPEKYRERYANRLPLQAVLELLERADAPDRGEQIDRDVLLLESLRDASRELQRRLGGAMASWRWGQLHQARLRHMLASTPTLEKVLNLAPVPRDGDAFTPLATGGSGLGSYDQTTGASYRHILDVSDWDRSVATSVPGQSGQPGSPHYADLLPLWAEGKYFPLSFSRQAVESVTVDRLLLEPR